MLFYRLLSIKKLSYLLFPLMLLTMSLTGCEDSDTETEAQLSIGQVEKNQAGWPRSIMTSKGLLTLQQAPKRIVSTSVTLSGTLLAINAPLVASGATTPNTSVASEQGFMRQWSAIAKERGLVPLYNTEPIALFNEQAVFLTLH
ncbi:hypothetical protein [Marinomonas sp.]|uniref:hypothetical protein n=1 Tax=Marinomonas sp. TaxID=1904862 RepID=UPI003C718D6C